MTGDAGATASRTAGQPLVHSAQLVTGLEQAASSLKLGALVEAARRGDEDAFSELYGLLAPGIFDYLVVLSGDRTAAEDLLQKTFLDAWGALASLKDVAKVRPWVYALARHVCQDHRRSPGATVPLEATAEPEAGEPGPEAVAISQDATRMVWSAAASLEPQHREALNLSLRHGLTYREIGDLLHLRPARAHDLLIRSREALGRAVQLLLVARSSASCSDLRMLAPGGTGPLTVEQRRTVDHHLRRCPGCQALAFRLTRPEELFGAVALTALPVSARHAPAPPLGPTAHLAAAHSAGAGSGAASPQPSLGWRRWGGVNRRALVAGGAVAALAVAGISVATIHPSAPSPTVSGGTTAQLDNQTLWDGGLADLGTLHSYTITFSTPSPVLDVTAFDITVGPPGSWFGTATNVGEPGLPITLADLDGRYYIHGSANLVAAPSLAGLTTGQAQALGGRWLDVTGASTGSGAMFEVLDGAATASSLGGSLIPGGEVYDPSSISRCRTTWDGQPVYHLSVVGASVDVTTGATPYLVESTWDAGTTDIGHLNEKVSWPDVSGAVTYQQLTGSPSP